MSDQLSRVFAALADPTSMRAGSGRPAVRRHRPLGRHRGRGVPLPRDNSAGDEQAFRGCFHTVRPDRIVQTFTWEGMPDGVALETMTFEDLGDGRTRLHALSLVRQLREPRHVAAQRHGDRRQRRVRRHRPDAGRWLPLSSLTADPARRHRLIADDFARRVHGADELVGGGAGVGMGGAGRRHPPGRVAAGLRGRRLRHPTAGSAVAGRAAVAAWDAHQRAVQDLLDDPATAGVEFANPHIGSMPLAQAIDRFYTSDVFMHTWDLARATGQDEHARPRAVRPDALRDGADRGAHAELRPVRSGGPGARRRRPADATARVHRPRSRVGARDAAVTPTLHKCLDICSNVRSNRRTPKRY